MKKVFCLIAAMTFCLCSCASDPKEDKTTGQSTTAAQTTTGDSSSTTVPEATDLGQQASGNLSTQKVIWGPGKTIDHQRPADPAKLQEMYQQYDAMFLMEDDKTVYLTFDEGYENGYTPSILDTLKEKKVSAVFFVTYDFAKSNPELIQRMIDEGHVVGNHTYRHKTMDEIDISTATEEVTVLHNYIKENFRYEMKYFRFPKGEFSESALSLVKNLGYKSMFWSFAYADWDVNNPPDKTQALEKITSSTHNGAIFLLHAVSATNAEILGQVVDNVRQQGYEFGTLS